MGTLFSDEGTAQLLAEVVEHLEANNLEQARLTLVAKLDFEQMLRPIPDPTSGKKFIDQAAGDQKRVRETGGQVRQCLRAIDANNAETALRFAKAAAARWAKP